jgi:hypothetical protein
MGEFYKESPSLLKASKFSNVLMGDLIKFKAFRPLFMILLVILRLLSEKRLCSLKRKLCFSISSKAETGNINFGTYYFTISVAFN